MPSNSAEYMREYRKRRRAQNGTNVARIAESITMLTAAQDRIRDLESEVARLKRLLAERPTVEPGGGIRHGDHVQTDGWVQFRPAPKPSQRKGR